MANKDQALEIGVLLHTAGLTGDGVAKPDLAPLWEQTTLVEDCGYASAWVGDSSRTETAWPRADCISIMTAIPIVPIISIVARFILTISFKFKINVKISRYKDVIIFQRAF